MGSGMSPLDPIFWLHHCNVDRIWAEWQAAGNTTPPLNRNYDNQFVNEVGQPVPASSASALHIAPMGYTYDTLSVPAVAAAQQKQVQEMADKVEQPGLPGREVLIAGANVVADGKSTARITIDLGLEPVQPGAKLELLLMPSAVSPKETYFVVVSMKTASGEKRLGAVSFFPPREGEVQAFYFDASPILAELRAQGTGRIDLSVALAPANRDKDLTRSSVRVVGARLVEK
jgi:hypothetical protein